MWKPGQDNTCITYPITECYLLVKPRHAKCNYEDSDIQEN